MYYKKALIISVLASSVSFAETKLSDSLDKYGCTIKEYISEQSSETSDLVKPFSVKKNTENDKVPADAIRAGNIDWHITRYDGLISVEAKEGNGRTISISTTPDGQPLGVKLPTEKQILTCNPPKLAKILNTDPASYGSTIQSLSVNPMSYGESSKINPLVERHLKSLKDPEMQRAFDAFLKQYVLKMKESLQK